jgi:hypothetical protein
MVRTIMIIIALFMVSDANAQFATARLSKKKVLVEQPIRVKITAYSPSWFAEPLTFSNLQVNGAFIQSFSRTVPGIRYIDNKKYATLEFYYILFPYQDGELLFPELTLTTSIPPEGDYKGKPVTLKTKSVTIQVDPVPSDADQEHWLIANNVHISNEWSANLKTLKVGDVVKRSITIKAAGTLPSFIDEPNIGTADFASIYSTEPEFIDDRDDKNVNGRRIDTYSYLMEKTGTFTISEVEITWWNPYVGKYYNRKLPAYEFVVAENPDMSTMQHLKDSLNSLNQPLIEEEEKTAEEVDYMAWAKIIVFAILGILLLRWIWKWILILAQRLKVKRLEYRESEAYWFDQIKKQKDGTGLLNAVYNWLDRANFNLSSKTLSTIAEEDQSLKQDIIGLQSEVFSTKHQMEYDVDHIKKSLSSWRSKKTNTKINHPVKDGLDDLNP